MIEQAIEKAKAEIRADVRNGIVPITVSSFCDLHSYVDANEYGGLTDGSYTAEEMNAVQDAVDKWLQDGGHR